MDKTCTIGIYNNELIGNNRMEYGQKLFKVL